MLSTLIGHDLKSKVFVFEFETFTANRHFYAQYLTWTTDASAKGDVKYTDVEIEEQVVLHSYVGTWWDHHEIYILHVFTAVIPDKVEVKDQKMQTEVLEIIDQQDTKTQEQGSLLLDAILYSS